MGDNMGQEQQSDEIRILKELYPKEMKYILDGDYLKYLQNAINELGISNDSVVSKANEIFDYLFKNKINELQKTCDLFNYDPSLFPLNEIQSLIINNFGLDNLRKFETETGYISGNRSEYLKFFTYFKSLKYYTSFEMDCFDLFKENGIDFKNGELSYEDFKNEMAKFIDYIRRGNETLRSIDYSFIKGDFKDKHPEIFMPEDAPTKIRFDYHLHFVFTPKYIHDNPELIPYLSGKNLINVIDHFNENNPFIIGESTEDIIEFIYNKFGEKNLLEMCRKYGKFITLMDERNYKYIIGEDNRVIKTIDNIEEFEKNLRKEIYDLIVSSRTNFKNSDNVIYEELLNSATEFVNEHPELFISKSDLNFIESEDERKKVYKDFYKGEMSYEDIYKYPQLKELLKDKNLPVIMRNNGSLFKLISVDLGFAEYRILEKIGNEKFLELCSIYGRYMQNLFDYDGVFITKEQATTIPDDFDELKKLIENIIRKKCKYGFDLSPIDAPEFLKKENPELFIADDAPIDLIKYFYNINGHFEYVNFNYFANKKEWLPYLKDKDIISSLCRRQAPEDNKKAFKKMLEYFGAERLIKYGMSRPEQFELILSYHLVDKLIQWYEKTGCKFIPDYVIIKYFDIKNADKFLTSASRWSTLTRINKYNNSTKYKEILLKMAYIFGVFDNDLVGFKKLKEFLTMPPKLLSLESGDILINKDLHADIFNQFTHFNTKFRLNDKHDVDYIISFLTDEEYNEAFEKFVSDIKDKYEEALSENEISTADDIKDFLELVNILKDSDLNIDFRKGLYTQLYKRNPDGSLYLSFNPQLYPRLAELLRNDLEYFDSLYLMNRDKAFELFRDCEMKYDPDFREFFLKNYKDIINGGLRYTDLLPSVHKQFQEIKTINSNRTLTFDLVYSYVVENKYKNVEVGNDYASYYSSISGYNEREFSILQTIYDYGKQRTYSSIPRIENTIKENSDEYSYEILRLDDPLAIAIGTLTNCCQAINDHGEMCMEHSMVDKNGRIFVVKDSVGNIISQSWVWRNGNVLCFDNIEIPNKAFDRALKNNHIKSKENFADEVYDIYKRVAKELLDKDEEVYKNLLEENIITQEQYDELILGKVTVGIGHNDIEKALIRNAKMDENTPKRPPEFEPPVELNNGLYLSDSRTQYILGIGKNYMKDSSNSISNIYPYKDTYVIYDDSNFKFKNYCMLKKLEIVTKGSSYKISTSVMSDSKDNRIVSDIASNYNLSGYNTRIIMNPNFAIVYEINGNTLVIADLLYNLKIDNDYLEQDMTDVVLIQIKNAIDQIKESYEIDTTRLNIDQLNMIKLAYSEETNLRINEERGINHAR